jgi:hypothetical protein
MKQVTATIVCSSPNSVTGALRRKVESVPERGEVERLRG